MSNIVDLSKLNIRELQELLEEVKCWLTHREYEAYDRNRPLWRKRTKS